MSSPLPWLDATISIRDGVAHWPDSAPVHIRKTLSIATGATAAWYAWVLITCRWARPIPTTSGSMPASA
jgi:hypothetical protein